jgi:mannose-1-phosphate guanylyltransferase
MFMFFASRYIEELARFAPEMVITCRKAFAAASRKDPSVYLDKEAFAACPSNSIDYAVMEKTGDAMVLPLDAGWSDVCSWSALWDIGYRTSEGNVLVGDILQKDTANSYLHAESRTLAAVGVENLVVVETADAVLEMAPVILALKSEPCVNVRKLATAQHRNMLDRAMNFFDIDPDSISISCSPNCAP